jgi:mating pheromone-induced death protein 2
MQDQEPRYLLFRLVLYTSTTSTTSTLIVSSEPIYLTPTPGTIASTVTSTTSSFAPLSSSLQISTTSSSSSSSISSSDVSGSYSSAVGVAYVGSTLTPAPFSTTITTTTTTTSSSIPDAASSSTSSVSASFSSIVGSASHSYSLAIQYKLITQASSGILFNGTNRVSLQIFSSLHMSRR